MGYQTEAEKLKDSNYAILNELFKSHRSDSDVVVFIENTEIILKDLYDFAKQRGCEFQQYIYNKNANEQYLEANITDEL
jgi:hypothetical protein